MKLLFINCLSFFYSISWRPLLCSPIPVFARFLPKKSPALVRRSFASGLQQVLCVKALGVNAGRGMLDGVWCTTILICSDGPVLDSRGFSLSANIATPTQSLNDSLVGICALHVAVGLWKNCHGLDGFWQGKGNLVGVVEPCQCLLLAVGPYRLMCKQTQACRPFEIIWRAWLSSLAFAMISHSAAEF